MTSELIQRKEIMEILGECPEHMFEPVMRVKTAEGSFFPSMCRVCGHSKVLYKGKLIEGTGMQIATFLADNGIKNGNQDEVNKILMALEEAK